jgi:hypothetical protein
VTKSNELPALIHNICRQLHAVQIGSANRGITGFHDVVDRFNTQPDKDRVTDFLKRWKAEREKLNALNDQKEPTFNDLKAVLTALRNLNTEFLKKFGGPRFAELIQAMPD